MKKNNSIALKDLIVVIPFLMITAFFFISYFLYPKQIRSETEYRFLAPMPEISPDKLQDFPSEFEKYFNDQLPYREDFLKLFSRFELMSGKLKVRDLYIVNDFLLPQEYLYPMSSVAESAGKTNALMNYAIENGKKVAYISLPYKTSVYNYMLPSYLQNNFGELNFEHFTSQLDPKIKVCDAFLCYEGHSRDELEKYFFKTDLHWNMKGAGVAFRYILDWLYNEELIDTAVSDDEIIENSYMENTRYLGDLNRRYSFLFPTNEAIPVFNENETGIKYYLSYSDDGYTLDRSSITDTTAENGVATYNSVYSNNLGYIKMVNDDSLLDTHILVIKDSMANAMTDMFSHVFKTTEFIDIRALKEVDLYRVIKDSKAGIVVLMYHQDNITGEMFNFSSN